ncbi:Protoheme IX farnesyltransferase [Candidatus Hepatincola sp. Av]
MSVMKKYIFVAKPGIVVSNLLTFFCGFIAAADGYILADWKTLIASLIGTTMALASSTTLNNFLDQDIDYLMSRTHNRVSVNGSLSNKQIILYLLCLGLVGFITLLVFVNVLTTLVILAGYLVYIVLYSMKFKRTTKYSTLIGSFSGATLPLAGYTAYANTIDLYGLSLFLILLAWQMPHFYAIGIFRINDYKLANIPVMPVATSVKNTVNHIFVWSIIFMICAILPFVLHEAGYLYIILVVLICLYWIFICYQGFTTNNYTLWAKQVFFTSLIVLMILLLVLICDKLVNMII